MNQMSGSSSLENTGKFLWLSHLYGLLHIGDQIDFLLTQVPIDPNGRADELARALLPITSYFAISSILVGYFKLPISRRFIRLSLHKATIGT